MSPEQFSTALNGWNSHHKNNRDECPSHISVGLISGGVIDGAWWWADDSDDVIAVATAKFGLALIPVQSIGIVYFREA
ncbi:hypothetical protein [Sphingobium amiense]|uniref:hypothetical protein n=1 Tax=Sphingobium amiense TaxID=135719 RepID=UPI00082D50CA|nr:hypothetical protein [Sphingobium amiense]